VLLQLFVLVQSYVEVFLDLDHALMNVLRLVKLLYHALNLQLLFLLQFYHHSFKTLYFPSRPLQSQLQFMHYLVLALEFYHSCI